MRMRNMYACVVVVAVVALVSSVADAQRVETNTYPSANVMDYGAKGDGHTDDTAAIKKAFNAIFPKRGAGLLPWMTEIVFPAGNYVISDAITEFSGMHVVRGEGYAKITQTNPDKDIFRSTYAWQITISGLSFEGGKHQIYMQNGNMDSGQIFIEKCKFLNASGAAIYTDVLSTTVTIANCRILRCEQAWVCKRSDQSIMRDTWITSSSKMKDKAVIENKGAFMTLDNILGCPHTNGTDQRWIDNYGMLRCVSFRFGGEGSGFTPVVNFSKYSTDGRNPVPVFVTLDHCWIYALGNKKRVAAVYLEEIPNAVKIIDCHGFARGVKLIGVSPKLDLKKILIPANKALFNFTFHGNVYDYGGIPEEMLPFTNVLPDVKGKKMK